MRSRISPVKLIFLFAIGMACALVLQFLGFNVVPPDKTSTLLGVFTGLVLGGGILWFVRERRTGG